MPELRLSGTEDYIPSVEIEARTQDLADYYTDLYGREEVLVLSVLKGAARFATHLAEGIRNPNIIEDNLKIGSMDGVKSNGNPEIQSVIPGYIRGMNVLLVEDIDDSRATLAKLIPRLQDFGPSRLDLVALLNKPDAPKKVDELDVDSIEYGFHITDRFVVGHGLDWNQRYRALPHISAARNVGGDAPEDQFWVPIVETEPEPAEAGGKQNSATDYLQPSNFIVAGLGI